MKFLGDVFEFERHKLKNMGKKVKENPEQLLIGAGDPFSAKVWGKVLNKDYEPLVDQWGGATKDDYKSAEAAGIDTKAGKGMHSVARAIASIYAGNYAADSFGAPDSTGGQRLQLGSVQLPQQDVDYREYRAEEDYSDPYIDAQLRGVVVTSTKKAKRELGSAKDIAVSRGIAMQNPVDANGVQLAAIKSLAAELVAAKKRLDALKAKRKQGAI